MCMFLDVQLFAFLRFTPFWQCGDAWGILLVLHVISISSSRGLVSQLLEIVVCDTAGGT